jgi:catechol 2,3-dioxygenase-like lactoylglutathione lyase family enzyme
MSNGEFGLSAIGQICITTKNLDKAVTFYRDVLGMKMLFQVPGMAFFDCGGIRLMIGPPEKPELDHPASIIYYKVDDIKAACETLKSRNVEFVEEPREVHKTEQSVLWLAFLKDMDGNVLSLMSEVPVS